MLSPQGFAGHFEPFSPVPHAIGKNRSLHSRSMNASLGLPSRKFQSTRSIFRKFGGKSGSRGDASFEVNQSFCHPGLSRVRQGAHDHSLPLAAFLDPAKMTVTSRKDLVEALAREEWSFQFHEAEGHPNELVEPTDLGYVNPHKAMLWLDEDNIVRLKIDPIFLDVTSLALSSLPLRSR